jgi:DNA polymerase-3 subunit chi
MGCVPARSLIDAMTKIDFYTNVSDKLHTACRIIAKAYGLGHTMFVRCPDAQTAQGLDRMLWVTPPTAFIPHCAPGHTLASITAVIVDHGTNDPVHDELLVNLSAEWPPYFGRFERLVEIVSVDPEDLRIARDRYKFYRDRGYEIRTHDLGGAASRLP